MWISPIKCLLNIDGLVQDSSFSSTLAMEIRSLAPSYRYMFVKLVTFPRAQCNSSIRLVREIDALSQYRDVTWASRRFEITATSDVCSTACSGQLPRIHQSSTSLALLSDGINGGVTFVPWHLKSLPTQLFDKQLVQDNNNENTKAPHYWLLCMMGIH